ncbi:hypothetical protein ACEV6Q_04125 [Enterobacter ludwigii]|uniref:hypothetical protein n=1 Tax=Enterobacter ludwigii TaxID=299767 RepID=UPI003BEEF373
MLIKETSGVTSKINFIDENDNFVGFDSSQSCCEHLYYRFVDNESEIVEDDELISSLRFTGKSKEEGHLNDVDDEEDAAVSFEVTDGVNSYWLELHNSHNGYYSHYWESNICGETSCGHI